MAKATHRKPNNRMKGITRATSNFCNRHLTNSALFTFDEMNCSFSLLFMGEAKTNPTRDSLCVCEFALWTGRMEFFGRDYLVGYLKLMVICTKIKETIMDTGRITIQNQGSYIWIFNPSSIQTPCLIGSRQELGRFQVSLGAREFSTGRLPSPGGNAKQLYDD